MSGHLPNHNTFVFPKGVLTDTFHCVHVHVHVCACTVHHVCMCTPSVIEFKGQLTYVGNVLQMMSRVIEGHKHTCTSYHSAAQSFFALYWSKQESFYEEELLRLKSITSPLHLNCNEIVELFT